MMQENRKSGTRAKGRDKYQEVGRCRVKPMEQSWKFILYYSAFGTFVLFIYTFTFCFNQLKMFLYLQRYYRID